MLLLSLAFGAAVGLTAGGRIKTLAGARLRGESGLVLMLILQGAAPLLSALGFGRSALFWLWAATFPVLIGLCVLNARLPGMALAAVGLALNALVILLNGGMPVFSEAIVAAGGRAFAPAARDFVHVALAPGTWGPFLADVLPVPGPSGLRGVASAGDLVMACGVAAWISAAMIERPATRLAGDRGHVTK